MALTRDLCWLNHGAFWCSEEVFQRISWLPGGGGLTAPLWTAGFRVVSAVVGACVLRLLVVFVPRTSSTPVATWFWQTEGRSAERVILGVRPSEFILSEFQSPSRRIFIDSHSLPPLWSPIRCFSVSSASKLPAPSDPKPVSLVLQTGQIGFGQTATPGLRPQLCGSAE
jgi:hypothetical protein